MISINSFLRKDFLENDKYFLHAIYSFVFNYKKIFFLHPLIFLNFLNLFIKNNNDISKNCKDFLYIIINRSLLLLKKKKIYNSISNLFFNISTILNKLDSQIIFLRTSKGILSESCYNICDLLKKKNINIENVIFSKVEYLISGFQIYINDKRIDSNINRIIQDMYIKTRDIN